ncbi:hypothetical protein PVL29_020862 [Vitis rotundifolia]|uniref:Uncharacterized protein n=1 Tax=Vitis rotundifolia TaxID=103349 RepID=A0AA38YYK8_VITRO|nr:hypothetical protein PVL29_020862 [Vitis rotundifolia]
MSFKARNELGNEVLVPKCISALLLILDNLLQSCYKFSSETMEGNAVGSVSDATGGHTSLSIPPDAENRLASDAHEKEPDSTLEKLLGKSTGYLTIEESRRVLLVACELLKQQVPAIVMQAGIQLCARLTKTHSLALEFLENGGMAAFFNTSNNYVVGDKTNSKWKLACWPCAPSSLFNINGTGYL